MFRRRGKSHGGDGPTIEPVMKACRLATKGHKKSQKVKTETCGLAFSAVRRVPFRDLLWQTPFAFSAASHRLSKAMIHLQIAQYGETCRNLDVAAALDMLKAWPGRPHD
jgi:hypothetical protein